MTVNYCGIITIKLFINMIVYFHDNIFTKQAADLKK